MTNAIFTDMTLKAGLIRIAIKDVLNSSKLSSFNADNKKSAANFFSMVINKVTTSDTRGKLTRSKDVMDVLSTYGIRTSLDLVREILNNKAELKKLGWKVDKLKSKTHRDGDYVSFAKKSHTGLDANRTIVIRSKYGNYPVLFYDNFQGSMTTNNKQINLMKMDYRYATGCNYYDARPVLLSTWLTMDPVHQQQTCILDSND